MKTLIALAAAIPMLALAFPVPAHADELVSPESLAEIKQGFDYVYNEEYEKAEGIFQSYIQKHPDRPEGYFFMAGRYAEQINTHHDRSQLDLLHKWADTTIKKSEEYNARHKNDPVGYFYLGNIYGYLGLSEAQEQNLIPAFMLSLKAKKNLERALEIRPNLYDCHFGLGTLYYYASRKHEEEGGLVGWVVKRFITDGKDMRADGIAMLRKAMANGGITSDVAYSSLMWVLLIEGKTDEAYLMAEEMARRWPRDKHGYWAMGRIHLLRNQCLPALANFETVRQLAAAQQIPPVKTPGIRISIELTKLCLNIGEWDKTKTDTAIKSLKAQLRRAPNIQMEYANSKGVIRDWTAMLDSLEKRTFNEAGERHSENQ